MDSNQANKSVSDVSQRQAALVAGVFYLIMFVTAIFAEFFARQRLVVTGDAAATVHNLLTSELLFRAGICGYLLIITCDVVVAWALYVFLRQVNMSLSLLTAWFRLVYSAIFGMALLNLVIALRLVSGADYPAVSESDQLPAQVLQFIDAFSDGWAIGYIFFSLHLFFLGYLAFKSGAVPRFLGAILIIASFGYMTDNLAKFLSPNYEQYEAIFMVIVGVPSVIGEMGLALWLLWKGGKGHRKNNMLITRDGKS